MANKTSKPSAPTRCDHTSVGMLVCRQDKLLLIERKKPPFGFAAPAGHVDDDISYEDAARRELLEEVGLTAIDLKLVAEGTKENPCRRLDGTWHHWKIYEVDTVGEVLASNQETLQFIWCPQSKLRQLAQRTKEHLAGTLTEEQWRRNPGLENVWYEWLSQLNYLENT